MEWRSETTLSYNKRNIRNLNGKDLVRKSFSFPKEVISQIKVWGSKLSNSVFSLHLTAKPPFIVVLTLVIAQNFGTYSRGMYYTIPPPKLKPQT